MRCCSACFWGVKPTSAPLKPGVPMEPWRRQRHQADSEHVPTKTLGRHNSSICFPSVPGPQDQLHHCVSCSSGDALCLLRRDRINLVAVFVRIGARGQQPPSFHVFISPHRGAPGPSYSNLLVRPQFPEVGGAGSSCSTRSCVRISRDWWREAFVQQPSVMFAFSALSLVDFPPKP